MRRTLWIVLGSLIVLLALVRWVGSPIATAFINRKLSALPGYPGHIDAVQLALWRGEITATTFTLVQTAHESDGPVLRIGHGSLTLSPLALLRGKIAGRIALDDVDVLFIQEPPPSSGDDSKAEKKEKKAHRDEGSHAWADVLQENLPLDMTHFEVSDLKVKFIDRAHGQPSKVLLEKVHLEANDFRAKPTNAGDLPGKLKLTGHFPGGGDLEVKASADASSRQPLFKATMEVKAMALVPMHDFLQSYANVDVHRGTFEAYIEANAEGGQYDGYVKPFFHDLEFKSVPDPEKNLAQRAATSVASAVQNLLKNDRGQVATKAPFQGNFADNRVAVWETIQNLLRNAFITSLREGFEGQKPNG